MQMITWEVQSVMVAKDPQKPGGTGCLVTLAAVPNAEVMAGQLTVRLPKEPGCQPYDKGEYPDVLGGAGKLEEKPEEPSGTGKPIKVAKPS